MVLVHTSLAFNSTTVNHLTPMYFVILKSVQITKIIWITESYMCRCVTQYT